MFVYNYDEETKEYLGRSLAEEDPAESKIQGEFVPLVPANATLVEPPITITEQIACFEDGVWVIKTDYRFTRKLIDENLNIADITEIGDIEGFTAINTIVKMIEANKQDYIYDNGDVRLKTVEEKAQEERERINKLSCTKRVLVLALEKLGFDYFETIQPLIESDRQAKLEWELCKDVERSNPLLNIIGQQLGITSEQIDNIFIEVNNGI